jgi:putative transposase
MRKTYSGEFKVKAVLEIFKEEKTISQIASDLEVHPNQLGKWKKEAIAGLAEVLEDSRRKGDKEIEALKNQIQELYAEIGELTTKLNWLKKNLASELSRAERIDLVDFNDGVIPLVVQTDLLSLNRTSLYYKPVSPSTREIEIKHAIDEIYTENPSFGSRTLTTLLKRKGHKICRATVASYMREMGIWAIFPKQNLSIRNSEHKVYPYLLRNITASYPNHIWGTDITYIRLQKGWLYLVAYIDWFSRYVLSWELDHTLEVNFVIEALKSALKIAKPDIVNSDQGSQFTSNKHIEILNLLNKFG